MTMVYSGYFWAMTKLREKNRYAFWCTRYVFTSTSIRYGDDIAFEILMLHCRQSSAIEVSAIFLEGCVTPTQTTLAHNITI